MTSTTALHFGPEWMRAKPAARPGPLPDGTGGTGSPAHSYSSSLLSTPATRLGDSSYKYTKDEMLQIWKDSVNRPELSLEVERWEGVINDDAHEPVGVQEMDEAEKKLFSQTLNSEVRRRQSQDTLALSMPGTSPSSGKFHGPSSPLRERPFSGMMGRRRDSDAAQPGYVPRRPSFTQSPTVNGPLSPNVASRPRMDGWLQRKKTGGLDGNKSDDRPRDGLEADNPGDGGANTVDITATNGADQMQNPGDTTPAVQDSGSSAPEPAPQDALNALANGNGHTTNGIGSHVSPSPSVQSLPPPSAINWSYKDPTGVVQGPFNGQLMHDWHNQGFFPQDLLMKRTEIDVEWRTLSEWEALGGKQFFAVQLTVNKPPPISAAVPSPPPVPALPQPLQPGYSPHPTPASTTDSFHAIQKPSRTSTLDTTATDSTNSSYNAAFAQPESGPYGVVRAPRFNSLENKNGDLALSGYGRTHWEHPTQYQDNGGYGSNFNGVVPASPSTSFSQSSFPPAQPITPYGAIGKAPGARVPRDSMGADDFGLSGLSLGSSALNHDAANGIGLGRPSPLATQRSRQASYTSDTAWQSESNSFVQASRGSVDPAIVSATRGAEFAALGRQKTGRLQQHSQTSAWVYTTQSQDNGPWDPASASVNDLHSTLVEEPSVIDGIPTPPLLEPTPPPANQVAAPIEAPPKRVKAPTTPTPIGKPVVPAQSPAVQSAQAAKSSFPWAKPADEVVKAKPTLRDIQDAEAKQAEALRKVAAAAVAAAPKDRPSAPRSATEDVQPGTTSWGLPTSQAGQIPRPAQKEASPSTPSPAVTTPGAPAAGVWTNVPKPVVAPKKTVKEIQEEEERRKRINAKDAEVIASAKRGYAQTANKTPTPSAWTTVGSSGKATPSTVATARPAAVAATSSPAPVASRVVNGATPRPAAVPQHTRQPSASKAADEPFVAPSTEFMKWLREALKDLNQVNLDEFMRLLLTFPIDPRDPGVVETIADTVYMYSSTMDGRRFAAEFCSRRKADAAAKKGSMITNPATKQTMVAEAVKSQPKPSSSQSEWKPASGKKKRNGKP